MDTENLKYTHNKCATQKFVHERVFNYQLLNEQARLFVYTDYWELFKGNSEKFDRQEMQNVRAEIRLAGPLAW